MLKNHKTIPCSYQEATGLCIYHTFSSINLHTVWHVTKINFDAQHNLCDTHLDCCNTMTLNYHVTIHYKLSYHYYGLLVSPLYSCTLCPFLIHLFMFNFFSPHSFLIQLSLFPNWQSHGLFQQQTTTNLIISCNMLSVVAKNMALLSSKWEVSM